MFTVVFSSGETLVPNN